MNDGYIRIIQEYLNELEKTRLYFPENEFKRCSYAFWTVADILDRISQKPLVSAHDTVWEYQMEIEYYCHLAQSSSTQFIFYTMRETAEQIAELICRNTKGEY